MTKFKKWDLLLIDWIDSMHISKWKSVADAISEANCDRDLEHQTVGFYLTESSRSLSVIQSKGAHPQWSKDADSLNVDALMTIPKVAITKIKKVK